MASVGTVIIDIKADTAKLVSGMDKAEKTIKKSISNIQRTVLTLASAYAGLQGIRAFKNMINDSLDAADAVGKLAQKLGLTSEQLSKYQYAAHFSAISTADLNAGLSAMIRRLNNFQRDGGGAAAKAFKELGISADYARKHFTSTDTAFKEILKRLEKMPDGFKKTAIAQDIFSKNASRILRLSAEDLKKFGDEAERIGLTISQSTYQTAAAYHDQMDRIDARLKGFKRTISFSLVKPLDAVSKTALKFVDNAFGQTSKEKILTFGKTGSKAIESIIYGLGFAKDTITGIEFVIDAIKIAFYGLADVIALALEPAMRTINTMIDAYNYIAKKLGKSTFDFHLQSSIPDINKKIVDIKNDMASLVYKMHDGRDAANEFAKSYKTNLKVAETESKKTKKSIDNTNTSLNDQVKLSQKIKQIWKPTLYKSIDRKSYFKDLFSDLGYSTKAYDKAVEIYQKLTKKYANDPKSLKIIKENYDKAIDNLNEWAEQSYKAHQKELKHIEKERKEYIRLHGTIKDGIEYQLKNYRSTLPTAYEQGIDMMKSITSTLDVAWTNFFDKQSDAFLDFGKLGKSIINEIEKEIIKTQVVKPITSATSDIIGSVTGALIDSLFDGWADGGYTYRDSSDKTPVGVVHANEYVIPANMVRKHPSLVAGLEAERRGLKPFWSGGSASDDASSSGFGGLGNGDSFGGIGNALGGSDYGDGTTINTVNTQNFVTNITTPSTVGTARIQSGIAPADITVVNLDPNAEHTFTTFDGYGNPTGSNGTTFNLGIIGKTIGAFLGALTGSGLVSAALGKVGEKIGARTNVTIGSTSLEEALGAKGTSSSLSSHISNTADTLTDIFGDDLNGDGGDFYDKYTGKTQQQAIDDINKQIIDANKADIIQNTKDLWDSMIGVIPDVRPDAEEDWTTLFKNYIKEGNKALLKVTLDGTLFDTPDFYSTWEKYAKSLNEDVQTALSNKLVELVSNQRGFKEWLYSYNEDDLGGLKYKADYLSDDLEKLEDSFNVTGLTIENFYEKQQKAIAENFTPEEIDKWKQLGNALMSATDATKKYKDTLNSYLKNANNFLNSLYNNTASNLSFRYYAQRYNDIKSSLMKEIGLGNYSKANEYFNSLKVVANNLLQTTNNTQNPTLSSSVLNQITKDINNYLGKIPKMAEGGVVTKPTLSLIGEAGYPEAVIPMKNGRDIPVKIDNSGMEQKLNDLVVLTEQQANEIRKMRKEIQDMNERSAA